MDAKDLDSAMQVLTQGTKRSGQSEDQRGWKDVAERG